MDQKQCSKCGVPKPRSEFGKQSDSKDGLRSACRLCRSTAKPKVSVDGGKRCSKCRSVKPFSEFPTDRRNRDGVHTACKECRYAANRQWNMANYDRTLATNTRWRQRNKETEKQRKRAWKVKNPDRVTEQNRRRRARLAGSSGSFTAQEWLDLCAYFGNRCIACGSTESLTADHIVPLVKGGGNSIDNIQPLCFSCNARKHTSIIDYRLFNRPMHAGMGHEV